MSDLRPPPAFAHLAALRTSARFLFWVLVIDLITSALLAFLLVGLPEVQIERTAVHPIPSWSWLLAGLCNLAVLAACLRFVWPLMHTRAAPANLLETSLRRLATMWRVMGAVALLGLLAGIGLVVWIFTTAA